MRPSRHRRGARTPLAAIAVIALCASLVPAQAASAKVAEYWAPIGHPDANGKQGWIEFKVKMHRNQKTRKFEPFALKKFSLVFMPANCTDGEPHVVNFIYPDLIPVAGRRWSLSDTRGDTTFETSGQIPRKGSITGTFRFAYVSGGTVDSQCDTGTQGWTAKRLAAGTL